MAARKERRVVVSSKPAADITVPARERCFRAAAAPVRVRLANNPHSAGYLTETSHAPESLLDAVDLAEKLHAGVVVEVRS